MEEMLDLSVMKKGYHYWRIPITKTTVSFWGTGDSFTHSAMSIRASAELLFEFCGNGKSPLLVAHIFEWRTPQSEYRPSEYWQGWTS